MSIMEVLRLNAWRFRNSRWNMLQKGIMRGSRVGVVRIPSPPGKRKSQNIGFFSVLVRISWIVTKLPSQHLDGICFTAFSGIWNSLPSPTKNTLSKLNLNHSDKTFWICTRLFHCRNVRGQCRCLDPHMRVIRKYHNHTLQTRSN